MIVELALSIVMIVIVITEFIKYIYPQTFTNCQEQFSENALFYHRQHPNSKLRYWSQATFS